MNPSVVYLTSGVRCNVDESIVVNLVGDVSCCAKLTECTVQQYVANLKDSSDDGSATVDRVCVDYRTSCPPGKVYDPAEKPIGQDRGCADCPDGKTKQTHTTCREKACEGGWVREGACDQTCGAKVVSKKYVVTSGNKNDCDVAHGTTVSETCPDKPTCVPCRGEWAVAKRKWCTKGWAPGCGQACAQSLCVSNGGVWVARDYSRHRYTCKIPDEKTCGDFQFTAEIMEDVDVATACDQTCGDKQVTRKYTIAQGGNDGVPCPFADGLTEAYGCPSKQPCVVEKTLSIDLKDSYGDGWNGGEIRLTNGLKSYYFGLDFKSGKNKQYTQDIACGNERWRVYCYRKGSYPKEASFTISMDGANLVSGNCNGESTFLHTC